MTTSNITAAIDALNDAQDTFNDLATKLGDQGKLKESKTANEKSAALTPIIRKLQSQALGQWTDTQDQVVAAITETNGTLQGYIDAINQTVQLAENITRALSALDQIVIKASSLL